MTITRRTSCPLALEAESRPQRSTEKPLGVLTRPQGGHRLA